jgi:hypothetical protein
MKDKRSALPFTLVIKTPPQGYCIFMAMEDQTAYLWITQMSTEAVDKLVDTTCESGSKAQNP